VYHTHDTIAAIASAPGAAARGIVRLSGPRVRDVLQGCFAAEHPFSASRPTVEPGIVALPDSPLRTVPAEVYFWPTARSYTRQAAAEIHTLGAPPVLAAVLRNVCAAGARLAEPGEFTLRAFLAGRIDLTQAEAVLGVIDARGAMELRSALVQLAGGLARPLQEMRDALIDLLARLEAGLDFVEEDIEFISRDEIDDAIGRCQAGVAELRGQLSRRTRSDLLPRVGLWGLPNAGKSSLFNALVGDGAALVSEIAGTTRDYLQAELDLGPLRCQLIDTAGIESPGGQTPIAAAAGELAAEQIEGCELRLLCIDASRPLQLWEQQALTANPESTRLVVWTKSDAVQQTAAGEQTSVFAGVVTSARAGRGIAELRQAIAARLMEQAGRPSTFAMTAERCEVNLRLAAESLATAREINRAAAGDELVAAELHAAVAELGKVAGTVYSEDILDRLFSRFCIGK